jgi:hypothetical protein
MSNQPIFLIDGDQRVVLESKTYDSEAILQELLTKHPAVLAGGTTEGDVSGGLLLIQPEIGIPRGPGGSDIFNLDHLFVDPDGIPVFVEVKRSSDTRIRREVVGQMLDYAANGTRYWPVSKLRDSLNDVQAEKHPALANDGTLGDQAVQEFIGGGDVEEFWLAVESNLHQGKVRLLFVADVLPPELVRIIEFLNEQMKPAEVLGVEVAQYVGPNDVTVLVPRLVGATSAAAEAKGSGPRDYWTKDTFFEVATQREDPKVVDLFNRLFAQVATLGGTLSWGKGATPGLSGNLPHGTKVRPVWLGQLSGPGHNSHPSLMFYFKELRNEDEELLGAMYACLSEIAFFKPALEGAHEVWFEGKGSYPRIHLDRLVESEADIETLLEAIRMAAT